jgi:hypothetical protein
VTGSDPFFGRSVREVLLNVVSGEFSRPCSIAKHLPPALDSVFQRAFAEKLDDRFPTADAFSRAFAESARPVAKR